MKYIKIKNKGLIEIKALSLVGATTKGDDDTKIGQFGSGNKYALAYFLRNNYEIKIFSGMDQIILETNPVHFRDNDFDVLSINGESTSITTEMGKQWDLWQAIREIYSNAIDEGESELDVVEDVSPAPDETHFYIELTDQARDFMDKFDSYFSEKKKVIFECETGQILEHSGTVSNIYRKGIKCTISNLTSIFDYNLYDIELDENRLVSFYWEPHQKIWDLIFRCDDKEVLSRIFHNLHQDCFENKIEAMSTINTSNMSDAFKVFIRSISVAPAGYAGLLKPDEQHKHLIIPTKIFEKIREYLDNKNVAQNFRVSTAGFYREVTPTEDQDEKINKALTFLKTAGFHIPYLIKLGIFESKDTLGCTDGLTIILSDLTLEKGVTDTVNTIIEEFIHIKYGAQDGTRGFQTAIITEFVSYMKARI